MSNIKRLSKEEWKEVEKLLNVSSLPFSSDVLEDKNATIYYLVTMKRKALKSNPMFPYRNYQGFSLNDGICHNLACDTSIVFFLSRYWPKFSGSSHYPIFDPDCSSRTTAQKQFYNLYKWEGKQKELRFEFLDFLIANAGKYYSLVAKAHAAKLKAQAGE